MVIFWKDFTTDSFLFISLQLYFKSQLALGMAISKLMPIVKCVSISTLHSISIVELSERRERRKGSATEQ